MPFRLGANRIGRLIVGEIILPSYDTDAQAFFTAVEGGGDTLTTTEKDATNQLVLDLKSAGIWSGMNAIYPFVGATSTSTKWNLKDPRDLDAAYRVTWSGTANFTADGITGTSNFVGNTHFNASTGFAGNPRHIGVYCNSRSSGGYDTGCNQVGSGNNNAILVEFNINESRVGFGGWAIASNTGTGHVLGTYDSSTTTTTLYLNGVSSATATTTVADRDNVLAIFADNRGVAGGAPSFTLFNTGRRLSTITFGSGLDSTESSNLYDAIQTFNTSLSRQA